MEKGYFFSFKARRNFHKNNEMILAIAPVKSIKKGDMLFSLLKGFDFFEKYLRGW
jgi:hypothetical protein